MRQKRGCAVNSYAYVQRLFYAKKYWERLLIRRNVFMENIFIRLRCCAGLVDLRILKRREQQNLISETFLWRAAEILSNLYQRILFLKRRWTLIAGAGRLGTLWNGRDVNVVGVAGRNGRHRRHWLAVLAGRLHQDDRRAVDVLVFLARPRSHGVHRVLVPANMRKMEKFTFELKNKSFVWIFTSMLRCRTNCD